MNLDRRADTKGHARLAWLAGAARCVVGVVVLMYGVIHELAEVFSVESPATDAPAE